MRLAMCACCILGLTILPTMFFGDGYASLDFVSILYIIVVVIYQIFMRKTSMYAHLLKGQPLIPQFKERQQIF